MTNHHYALLDHPRFLLFMLILFGVWHIFLASITPLSVDEAHYALYGLHFDLSYFDHPPLVGWGQSLILLVSDQELALRLIAIVSYSLTMFLLHRSTLAYFDHNLLIANVAILLFALMPMSFLLGMAVVPETLLMPLVIALFWQSQRTLTHPSLWQWTLLGILIGLSGLTKYTSILMAFGLLLILLSTTARQQLLKLGFWLALSIAFVMMSSVIIWNIDHDWISITYQLNHGAPNEIWTWSNLMQSQLSQILSYSPIIWIGAWFSTLTLWRYRQDKKFSINVAIWLFALPGLVVFTLASGKEPSLPHWLLFFYMLWLPWISSRLVQTAKRLRWTLMLSFCYAIILFGSVTILLISPQIGSQFTPNPAQDIFGWKDVASQAKIRLNPNEKILIPNWVEASRIAWYTRPTSVIVLDHRFDQFDLWFGSAEKGISGLFVLSPDYDSTLLSRFTSCTKLTETEAHFRVYRCQDWQDY